MRGSDEYIARKANREDKCTGRFWQGRFKSQALLDEATLITCMAYVDLNPIRAKLADTPERSDYTSIQQRILAKHEQVTGRRLPGTFQVPLLPFADEGAPSEHALTIPMHRDDYLELVDWTGRVIRETKKGAIPEHIKPILQRLCVDEEQWAQHVQHFGQRFYLFAGSWSHFQSAAQRLGRQWLKGARIAKAVYREVLQT